MGFLSSLKTI